MNGPELHQDVSPTAEEQVRPRRGLLARLLGRPAHRRQPHPPVEHREHVRHPLEGSATLTEVDKHGSPGRSWPVEVLDLGRGGAAIATAIFIAPGTGVMIQFPATASSPARQLPATIRHIRRRDELSFAAGLKFDARGGRMSEGARTFNLAG